MKNIYIERPYHLLFGLATLVNIIGILFIPLMDVDATQYASISLEMLQSGNYLQLMNHYQDYLDKPPFLFWTAALSYKIFGVSAWAYRLPSFLFSLLGVYSTYKLTGLFYNKRAALNAALILYTSQALFLIHHDVRTDTILTATVVFSTWQFIEYLRYHSWPNFIGAFVGIGIGMLEKGPLGLVVPAAAVGSHILVTREWKYIFKWQWLAGLAIVGLMLLPMFIGLYQQFDLQPEKIVNGRSGVSGIRFFLWEQSFGRITGENVWKDDSTPLFFTHSFLWSFLPWSVLALVAFYLKCRDLISCRFHSKDQEFLSLGAFIIPFAALSLSQYKLPHYVFVTYPFAAIFTAAWLDKPFNRENSVWKIVSTTQYVLSALLIVSGIALNAWAFPFFQNIWVLIPMAMILVVMILQYKINTKDVILRMITLTAMSGIFLNFLLNSHLYPGILKYQAGTQIANYLDRRELRPEICYAFKERNFALDACSGIIWKDGSTEILAEVFKKEKEIWLYTNEEGFNELNKMFLQMEVKEFPHFHPTKLSMQFLNPDTRLSSLKRRYLIHLKDQQN